MPLTQANRVAAIGTPLGEDVLVLQHATIHEQLGGLFQIEAGLLSENGSIHFEDIVGENVTIRLAIAGQNQRYFNGTVSRFTQMGSDTGYAAYHAVIVPHLWLLTRASECRIFQQKTVPDIIKQIFSEFSVDHQESLSGNYEPREYCVQYRETDFNFISRLMEEEGIYYYFKHEDGKHTVILCDAPAAHTPADSPYDTIEFRPYGSNDDGGDEFIRDWIIEKALLTGAYAHTDFDFEAPKKNLFTTTEISREHAQDDIEVYDYPGLYTDHDPGENYSKIRIQEIQAGYEVVRGEADARGIETGFLFSLKDALRSDQDRKYLVTSVSHSIQSDSFDARKAQSGPVYRCSFTAIPSTEPFRPARLTPKPYIQGPQTAMVVGPRGEEIYTDKYGRVKVHFHWDRFGTCDENSSCWIRVSQVWAGKSWGGITNPRIGHEVIVEFLEGDPDRPIITGRVYNGDEMPPYPLPANQTMSTIKSNSSKGGQGFNELRFEDKKGSEQIFIHAEKNQDVRVKNDAFEWIGNDRHLIVIKDQFEHVENNRHETVDASHMEQIGKDRNLTVTGKEAVAITGSKSLTVTGDVIEVFKGNHSEVTTGDVYVKGNNVVIEGMTNVTIKVGGSYVAIDATGVTISGPMVQIQGSGMVQVTGGVVTIN